MEKRSICEIAQIAIGNFSKSTLPHTDEPSLATISYSPLSLPTSFYFLFSSRNPNIQSRRSVKKKVLQGKSYCGKITRLGKILTTFFPVAVECLSATEDELCWLYIEKGRWLKQNCSLKMISFSFFPFLF